MATIPHKWKFWWDIHLYMGDVQLPRLIAVLSSYLHLFLGQCCNTCGKPWASSTLLGLQLCPYYFKTLLSTFWGKLTHMPEQKLGWHRNHSWLNMPNWLVYTKCFYNATRSIYNFYGLTPLTPFDYHVMLMVPKLHHRAASRATPQCLVHRTVFLGALGLTTVTQPCRVLTNYSLSTTNVMYGKAHEGAKSAID